MKNCEVIFMDYIEKLDRLRYEKGISFRRLGVECKLSESAVKKIFYRKCDPRISSIECICRVLGTSLPDLFGATDKTVIAKPATTDAFVAVCAPISAEVKSRISQIVNALCE